MANSVTLRRCKACRKHPIISSPRRAGSSVSDTVEIRCQCGSYSKASAYDKDVATRRALAMWDHKNITQEDEERACGLRKHLTQRRVLLALLAATATLLEVYFYLN